MCLAITVSLSAMRSVRILRNLCAGHLGASLGVVELTVALHYVFNTPDDKVNQLLGPSHTGLSRSHRDVQHLCCLTQSGDTVVGTYLCDLLANIALIPHQFGSRGCLVCADTASALLFAVQIIWDVGHQAYGHKILTGRRNRMPTIRQTGGLSGEYFLQALPLAHLQCQHLGLLPTADSKFDLLSL